MLREPLRRQHTGTDVEPLRHNFRTDTVIILNRLRIRILAGRRLGTCRLLRICLVCRCSMVTVDRRSISSHLEVQVRDKLMRRQAASKQSPRHRFLINTSLHLSETNSLIKERPPKGRHHIPGLQPRIRLHRWVWDTILLPTLQLLLLEARVSLQLLSAVLPPRLDNSHYHHLLFLLRLVRITITPVPVGSPGWSRDVVPAMLLLLPRVIMRGTMAATTALGGTPSVDREVRGSR